MAAVAVAEAKVWRCGREEFLWLLAEHPAVHLELTKVLSGRLVYKSMMLAEIAVEEAEHRLATRRRDRASAAGRAASRTAASPSVTASRSAGPSRAASAGSR